jgi:carbohydrate kinase (thermoresistant glucokinase family)
MGVAGSGKSSIGPLLAEGLGTPFLDADTLHSEANVAKMSAGTPLTDDDRWPWLARVGRALGNSRGPGLVVACSALRRTHRQAIREHARSVAFVHLAGSAATLASRLSKRSGHFMPVSLLDSQLDALEPLAADEAGVTVDIERSMEDIVRVALSELRSATPA